MATLRSYLAGESVSKRPGVDQFHNALGPLFAYVEEVHFADVQAYHQDLEEVEWDQALPGGVEHPLTPSEGNLTFLHLHPHLNYFASTIYTTILASHHYAFQEEALQEKGVYDLYTQVEALFHQFGRTPRAKGKRPFSEELHISLRNALEQITIIEAAREGMDNPGNIDTVETSLKASSTSFDMVNYVRACLGIESTMGIPANNTLLDPTGEDGLREEVYDLLTHKGKKKRVGRCPAGCLTKPLAALVHTLYTEHFAPWKNDLPEDMWKEKFNQHELRLFRNEPYVLDLDEELPEHFQT